MVSPLDVEFSDTDSVSQVKGGNLVRTHFFNVFKSSNGAYFNFQAVQKVRNANEPPQDSRTNFTKK